MPTDISKEPLQNKVAANVGVQKAWRMLATDLLGNRLLLDSLSWLIQYDYSTRTDGQPLYMGFAAPGTADATPTWLLHKFTYSKISGTDFVIKRDTTINSWTLRDSAF